MRLVDLEDRITVEEDIETRFWEIRCADCRQSLRRIDVFMIEDIPQHHLPEFLSEVIRVALRGHLCEARIARMAAELSQRSGVSIGEAARSMTALASAFPFATEAVGNVGESIRRLNTVRSGRASGVGTTSPAVAFEMLAAVDPAEADSDRTVVGRFSRGGLVPSSYRCKWEGKLEAPCQKCGEMFPRDDMRKRVGKLYCAHCMMLIDQLEIRNKRLARKRAGIRVIRFSGGKNG